jgi:uncharacterized protein YabE (DUF348 family)
MRSHILKSAALIVGMLLAGLVAMPVAEARMKNIKLNVDGKKPVAAETAKPAKEEAAGAADPISPQTAPTTAPISSTESAQVNTSDTGNTLTCLAGCYK